MMKSIKRLVLTGAAVMVMMSFAAPAMAAQSSLYVTENSPYSSAYLEPEVVGPTPVQLPWDADYTGLRHCWQDLGNGQWQEIC
jgi:hypothetical protein